MIHQLMIEVDKGTSSQMFIAPFIPDYVPAYGRALTSEGTEEGIG